LKVDWEIIDHGIPIRGLSF